MGVVNVKVVYCIVGNVVRQNFNVLIMVSLLLFVYLINSVYQFVDDGFCLKKIICNLYINKKNFSIKSGKKFIIFF